VWEQPTVGVGDAGHLFTQVPGDSVPAEFLF
jgi:hypothetical protein